jgi:hypothetical protein
VRRAIAATVAIAAVVAMIALGGCDLNKEIDTDRAEAEIKRDLSAQTGAQLRSVRCPDEVEAKKGERFRCTAVAEDGSRIPIRVTQTDDDGGVRWRVGR